MTTATVPKPWGHELIWAKTDRYVGKVLHIRAGEALSLQYHRVKDETIMVLAGELQLVFFAEGEVLLHPGRRLTPRRTSPTTRTSRTRPSLASPSSSSTSSRSRLDYEPRQNSAPAACLCP